MALCPGKALFHSRQRNENLCITEHSAEATAPPWLLCNGFWRVICRGPGRRAGIKCCPLPLAARGVCENYLGQEQNSSSDGKCISFLKALGSRKPWGATWVIENPTVNPAYLQHTQTSSLTSSGGLLQRWVPCFSLGRIRARTHSTILSDPPKACSSTAAPLQGAQGSLLSQLPLVGSQDMTECWESIFPAAFPFHFDELAHSTCSSDVAAWVISSECSQIPQHMKSSARPSSYQTLYFFQQQMFSIFLWSIPLDCPPEATVGYFRIQELICRNVCQS